MKDSGNKQMKDSRQANKGYRTRTNEDFRHEQMRISDTSKWGFQTQANEGFQTVWLVGFLTQAIEKFHKRECVFEHTLEFPIILIL